MTFLRSAGALGAILLGSWCLTACGGSDSSGPAATDKPAGEAFATSEATEPDDVEDGGRTQSGFADVRAPEFVLTGPVDAPSGWVLDPSRCSSSDESGPPFFDYYVPGDWVRTGGGYGGSGGVMGSGDHDYELPDGLRVTLRVETDTYIGTDPVDANGEPWSSWDKDFVEYTDSGEQTTRITYAELDPVEIDGISFDLHHLDQAQSEMLYESEYKLRIVFGDVPTGGAAGRDRRPESATVTIAWDADRGELSEAVAREVLETFRLSTCAQEGLVELYETNLSTEF